ncbi:MAG: thermonuclease family protein [Sphingomonadales bacterium]
MEVRLADFYAPEISEPEGPKAKAALEQIAMGKRAECVAQHRSYDRVVAVCKIGGTSIAGRMRDVGIAEGGNGR